MKAHTSMKRHISLTITVILLFLFFGEAIAMNIFKNDFEQRWEELSKDVKKLNEYTTKNPVELRKVKIQDKDIEGAIFINANFDEIEWESTNSQKSSYTKVVFENCKFLSSNFSYSNFINVVFKNCEFNDADFNRSNLAGVIFENCKFEQMGLVENKGDTLEMRGCQILNSGIGDSTIDLKFSNCTLDGVDISVTKGARNLIIEDSLLSEVDFGDSNFSDIILRKVRQREGGIKFNGIIFKNIKIEDSQLPVGIGLGNSTGDILNVTNSSLGNIGMEGSKISKISFRNSELHFLDFKSTVIDNLTATICDLVNLRLRNGFISEFKSTDSTIAHILGQNFKSDIVVWDNVTIDGKIDFTNAQIEDFRPTRINRGSTLQLITTGSNIKF